MSAHLLQVTAKSNNGKLPKALSTEIYKTGTTRKPNQNENSEALSRKYDLDTHYSHCGSSNFDFGEVCKQKTKFNYSY